MSGKATVSTARRTSSLTSGELPRPRRSSAQGGAAARQADKENQPVNKSDSRETAKVAAVEKSRRPDVNSAMSTLTPTTAATMQLAAPPLARHEPLEPKSDNVKAFQSAVSPLMHFDDPTIAMFSGLAISGGGGGGGGTGDVRSVSSPAVLQQHTLSANLLAVPPMPHLYKAGFGTHDASAQYLAPSFAHPSAYYYYPAYATESGAHHQSYAAPSPPETPLSAANMAAPPASITPNGITQARNQQYPASLGLGHPVFYAPTPPTARSPNTSLSLSSVAGSSLGFSSVANSRSTSASSAVSFGGGSEPGPCLYPIPYAYPTGVGSRGYVSACGGGGSGDMTVRERLEGGEVLSSRGACKFFDVEKVRMTADVENQRRRD